MPTQSMNGFSDNLTSFAKAVWAGAKEFKRLSLSNLRKVFSLMGRNEKIALAALLAAAIISLIWSGRNFYFSHTAPAAAEGGSLTEGMIGQPSYINPLLAHLDSEQALTELVFSGLYKYDSKGNLIPDLADGMPQISDDQKQYTINLRRDAKWHNGKPVTADDVVYTLQLLKDPAYKSPLRSLWQSTSVEKLSDYSIKFTTKDVSGPFQSNLTLPIISKNVWSRVEAQNFLLSNYNMEAVGSGPYAIKEIKKLASGKIEQIILQANSEFYAGRPKISQIIVKFYDSESDLLNAFHSREITAFGFTSLTSSLYLDQKQNNSQILHLALPQYQVVFFNLNNKILSDISVRKALSLATDRQAIIKEVFQGNALLPASPFLFESSTSTEPASADLEQAKKLLDSAGWAVNETTGVRTSKKGTALEITLSTSDSLTNSKAAELLAGQWRQLNIKVNLNVLPAKQLSDSTIKNRDFDVLLFPQKFGTDPDPFLSWHSSQIKDPGVNLTGFQDSTADKLITEARTTTDRAIREADYQQFNQLIEERTPIILLDQTEYIYALDEKIKNVDLNKLYEPSLRFSDIANWYINEKRVWK